MVRTRFTLPAAGIAVAGLLLAGCGGDSDDPGAEASATAPASANGADADFARQMIEHHAQAIEMARLVPSDGVSAELTDLAAAVEAVQQPEIDQLTAMLERWGEDPSPSSGGGHDGHGGGSADGMMSAEDMDALGAATGAEFERLWLEMMIEHHRGAIAMAEAELAEGADAEALALAQAVVDAQEAEIAQMETMLGGGAGAAGAADGAAAAPAFSHIHGLGADAGLLYVATHEGLYEISAAGAAALAGPDDHDFMGFTMTGAGEFLASGHPNSRTDLPGDLGLLESADGGASWVGRSLSGEVDFHALDAKGSMVYGWSSGTGELLSSTDRTTWERLGQVGLADLTVHPDDDQTLLITTEDGPRISADGGRTFGPLDGAPVLFLADWPRTAELYGVTPDGTVQHSPDGGTTWHQRSALGERPQAITVGADGAVYAALEDSIVVSADGGDTFTELYTWA
ncbi:F510_1955 family glycosylhydrolase [Jiangella sp. DSM 45060]|uniref:F510_1955 family glycosylhydrolase n=1 Tax=Jiangella sp. DSM 45060 TaxID=1798224 RepID=UPI00087B7EB5|nr:DUF305 domain-containing protein [Jiangella sp. DSM 45060]SDS77500.1 Uncharacterized conserved protein, DUF305 family [Jiangella sp. DSM 45060]